ncbi:ABC transporter ATP-binding protein [Paenibacillus soyae]|uniref:ABC transporter ATP-binding protein n=1 Tax=Paenibacillus soyae TaxID=2969249 RepID=A0A9X2S7D8_9BACL|nr:ABC transporter ATP-binding protein [Paenibacillus soyae]MCR2802941.1 ABC transporter ATP-binding protein [Paenibacillus soyae]
MQETVLSVQNLSKKINGKTIVDDVSFELRAGEILGFLGPNGAGKTTTIRMLVDLIKPTSGTVTICGKPVQREPEQALRHVGSIVENPEMYGYMTGWQNLEHFARMQDGIDEARIREVTSIVKLQDRIHDKVKTYSLGMRQRLGIAQALLGRPKLLILDEPTNGLDPKGIKELRTFIRQLAQEGLCLLVSSHLLSEVQLLCDRFVIIHGGKVAAAGTVEQLIRSAGNQVLWQFEHGEDGIRELLKDSRIQLIERIDYGDAAAQPAAKAVTAMSEELIPETVARLAAGGVRIHGVCKAEPTLEEMFLTMTESETIA